LLWNSTNKIEHDLLSSPEYPSTSSDLRMIPQPPPPPKVYYIQQQRLRGRHQHAHHQYQPVPTRGGRPQVMTPLSHHPNAMLSQRRRATSNYPSSAAVSNDDSDV